MKEFAVYTAMRVVLFLGSFAIVVGIWSLIADGRVHLFWAVIASFLLSGIASWFLLQRQRQAFAVRVEDRAGRAVEKFEEMKAREDTD